MAVQHGVPGEWARVRGTILSLWPLFVSFACSGAFATALLIGSHQAVFGGLVVASLVAVALTFRKGARRVQSFFTGARGEERVGGLLSALPDNCHVYHDFVAGRHHVDHVVATPAGIFAVETKTWRGRVTIEENHVLVDGELPSRSPVSQALAEAAAVRTALKKAGCEWNVTPVVCFASDTFDAGVGSAGAVAVVNADELVGWFSARPPQLSEQELDRIVKLMESSAE